MTERPTTTWATRTLVREGRAVSRTVRAFVIEVRAPGAAPQRLRFGQDVVRVGSREPADLVVADPAMSRLHCEISADERGYRLRDLGSTNGTFVDDYLVRDLYLRDGSQICTGDTTLVFEPTEESVEVPIFPGETFAGAVGRSVAMREVFAVLARAAATAATVLLEGESGTGKEILARAVHGSSKRREGPLVVVDCGAVPSALLESMLFGHEKGAFTGATERRIGLFEEAHGGTVFLDEIGELPLDLQPKLLRVLEARSIRRVGGTDTMPIDIRVVAATNRDLAEETNRGAFREDLYYRLAVIRVRVPPLRERRDDVVPLLEHFVRASFDGDPARAARVLSKVDAESRDRLVRHPWPGNVRELRNVVERSLALRDDSSFSPDTTRPTSDTALAVDLDTSYGAQKAALLERFDRDYFLGQLERHGGNVSRAARAAGMERMHFKRMLAKYR